MLSNLDCFPCLMRQSIDIIRRVIPDNEQRPELFKKILRLLTDLPNDATPARLAAEIHRLLRTQTGIPDLYVEQKQRCNEIAQANLPLVYRYLENSTDRVATAARIAVAGNIIDYGAMGETFDVEATLRECLQSPLAIDDLDRLKADLKSAKKVMYVGDNAGEIVFDRIFVEEIKKSADPQIIFVVRGHPILNDVTLADAQSIGLTQLAEIVASGGDAPGCELDRSSIQLRHHFKTADLIISKGQGNYEALSQEPYNIYFILKVKCPVIAGDIGARKGDSVIKRCGFHKDDPRSS
jgi:damage-control phosphatase, subfamily I